VAEPFPWERPLWRGRPSRLSIPPAWRERYLLTDVRLARLTPAGTEDLPLTDIAEIHRQDAGLDRWLGTSTITVQGRAPGRPTLVLRHIRRGVQVAALLELLSGDPSARVDLDAAADILSWRLREPGRSTRGAREAIAAAAVVVTAIFAVAIGLHGKSAAAVVFPADDRIAPDGQKRPRDEIMRFMNDEVMPWARGALGRIVGGPDRVHCETCHGRDPDARDWRMPGVSALPEPVVRERGWERFGDMDAQMRNAIYGYVADSDKQARATYMREVVMPGMARLLRRPAYDFTRSYAYNRRHAAFGCYHCHKVK
jgi:hypothetical protein